METCLVLNGYELGAPSIGEQEQIILSIALGRLMGNDSANWLKDHPNRSP